MLSIIGNRKIIVSILTMVFLIVGVQGISYAQAVVDLEVRGLDVSPDTVGPGGEITFTATVEAMGPIPNAVILDYYRSNDSNFNIGIDAFVASKAVEGLTAANREKSVSISFAAPTSIRTHYYFARVRPATGETNLTNNLSNSVPLTVTNVQPNLTVTLTSPHSYNVYNPPYSYYNPVVPGGTFTLVATVRNNGVGVSSTDLSTELVVYRTPATSPGLPEVTQSIRPPSDPTLNRGESDTYTITMRAPFQPGTYNYYVTLPSVPGNAATRRSSNTVPITTASADLVVDTATVNGSTSATLAPSESFTLTATVRNQGTGNSTAATLQYYRSTDATISITDTPVGTTDSIDILSGSNTPSSSYSNTSTQTVDLTAPSEPGTYYYGACVSTTLYESRRDNNCSSAVTITVSAPPDLVAELFELRGTATLAPGERFTLEATVTNEGEGQSATTTLRFYESTDRRFRSEDEVDRVTVSALASDRASNESIRLVAPSEPGTYYYRVHVDEVANEEATFNNWSGYIVIFVEAPLVIESLQPSKFALAAGERFTLTATIKNDGDTASTRTTVQYYRSDDESITSRDTTLGTETVSAIAAGRTTQVSRSLNAPDAGGTYYYGVCIGDGISRDNCAVIKISVVAVLIAESQRPPMYWIDAQAGTLQTLTGSSVDGFVQNVQNATGVAIDAAAGKVYWTEDLGNKTGRIRRANLDGTNVQVVGRVTGVPKGIAIDASQGRLYMIHSWGKVQQLDVDGESFPNTLIKELESPQGIAVDTVGGKVYWTEEMSDTEGRIRRANLDGTNVQLVRELTGVPKGIGVDPTNGKLYVANSQGQIHRLDLNGRNFQPNFIRNLKSPQGIAVDVLEGKVYWTEEGKIQRADLDGKNIQSVATGVGTPTMLAVSTTTFTVLIPEAQRPPIYWQTEAGALQSLTGTSVGSFAQTVQNATGLAVDTERGRVYWTEQTSTRAGRVRRANLNGANVQVVRELTGVPKGIAIDASRGRLYIINSQGTVQRLNLDGTNFEADLVGDLSSPNGIAVDAERGKVYWTEDLGNKTGRIQSANLDGTNVQMIRKVTGIPRSIAIDVSRGKLYVTHSWGKVLQMDLNGENHQSNFISDLDSPQGIAVDAAGGKIYWAASGKIQRANVNGRNIQDVVTGLGEPVGIALNAPATRRATASAPAAAAIAPNATALHTNYPNPFNPETWIPYQLQKPTEVQISIYNQSGILIRELSLGYQAAGQYISRSRAAYWDGRNQVGEPVASGLYFYTLTAGDFSATRKMLILK